MDCRHVEMVWDAATKDLIIAFDYLPLNDDGTVKMDGEGFIMSDTIPQDRLARLSSIEAANLIARTVCKLSGEFQEKLQAMQMEAA